MSKGKVIVIGINGHIGHMAVEAFVSAGWDVSGFGRSNKHPVAGVRFIKGDADSVADLAAAIAPADVVVNALNLPYHTWGEGRLEAVMARVVEAMGTTGKTLVYPGSIYNYAMTNRYVTPDLPMAPPAPRGEIRVRIEQMYQAAAARGDIQAIVLRAGDFYGPETTGDWFDQAILREAGKGKVATFGVPGIGHSWAYLPDVARAFVALAEKRETLGRYELFHFAGNFVTPEQMTAAIVAAAPVRLKAAWFPRYMLTLMGIVDPLMRDIAKMGYLWENAMELRDARLDQLLGPNFATPFAQAVKASVLPFFAEERVAA